MGVHDNTLRRWADQGLVQSQRTAGGHRRFQSADLSLLRPGGGRSSPHDAAGDPSTWQPENLEADQRQALATVGRRLAQLVQDCLEGKAPTAWPTDARQIGRAYALRAQAIGLPLSAAVAAFVHYRAKLLQGLRLGSYPGEALARYEAVVGAVLVGLAQGYESCLTRPDRGADGHLAAGDGDLVREASTPAAGHFPRPRTRREP